MAFFFELKRGLKVSMVRMPFAELHIFASWIKKTYCQMSSNEVIHSAIPDRQKIAVRIMRNLRRFLLELR
jgi:hypothetical protein